MVLMEMKMDIILNSSGQQENTEEVLSLHQLDNRVSNEGLVLSATYLRIKS